MNNSISIKKLSVIRILITGSCMLFVASVLGYFFLTTALVSIEGNYRYLIGAIVFLIISGSFFNFYRGATEKIYIKEGTLYYKRRKLQEIPLHEIKGVSIVKNKATGFALKNIIFRMIANALMGSYQIAIEKKNSDVLYIPIVAGGGGFMSPNVGFTKSSAMKAQKEIEKQITRTIK